jgi:hypothetical protein
LVIEAPEKLEQRLKLRKVEQPTDKHGDFVYANLDLKSREEDEEE